MKIGLDSCPFLISQMEAELKTDKKLKLVAIVPPEPLYSFVKEEQNFIAQKWNARQALRTPPHITLIPPISLNEGESEELKRISQEIASKHPSFRLKVNRYDSFNPKVIYLKPSFPHALSVLYTDLLKMILANIPHAMQKYPYESFVPHITLAYRDLDPLRFKEVWKYYKNKKVNFAVDINRISILDNTADGWVISDSYELTSNMK